MKLLASEIDEPPSGTDVWGNLESYISFADMDDIWTNFDKRTEKFDMLDIPFEDLFDASELSDMLDMSVDTEHKDIVHHDCMWAGTCSDKYHPWNTCPVAAVTPTNNNTPATNVTGAAAHKPAPATPLTPNQQQPPNQTHHQHSGRSLLISAASRTSSQQSGATATPPARSTAQQHHHHINNHRRSMTATTTLPSSPPSPRRPDTPQSLDEEEPPRYKDALPARLAGKRAIAAEYDEDDDVGEEDDDDDEGPEDDDDECYDDDDYKHPMYLKNLRENTIASDHSYTLSKNSKPTRVDLPGVQTPSDSEEEIDVVSLGEKMVGGMGRGPVGLPANPSPLARRQLQRTMASAVAERSRPMSSQPRKRPRDRSASPLMRHRKRSKQQHHHQRYHMQQVAAQRQSPPKRRPYSSPNSDSEAETIERRSLHNDMERQRRIGLKNLFDELKLEVPSICHKDRAPKVVVLREAAALCLRLHREDREREHLVAKQMRLRAHLAELRTELASRRPI